MISDETIRHLTEECGYSAEKYGERPIKKATITFYDEDDNEVSSGTVPIYWKGATFLVERSIIQAQARQVANKAVERFVDAVALYCKARSGNPG